MNLKNQGPIFVPEEHVKEIEAMSKAALMDLAWDLAVTCAGGSVIDDPMVFLRMRRDTVLLHRKQAKAKERT